MRAIRYSTAFMALAILYVPKASGALPTGRYLKVVRQMEALQRAYPRFLSLYSTGRNDDGVEILAMRISTTPDKVDPKKVGQILVSTHHGDEGAAPLFTLY